MGSAPRNKEQLSTMIEQSTKRETLATRLGFIMLSAGCAIGLGNVWRFPFIVGKFGGGIFVFLYLFFLAMLGFPVLMVELAIGRAGRSNLVGSFRKLAVAHKTSWTILAHIMIAGGFILMIYYTCVSGWLFAYTGYFARGVNAACATAESNGQFFNGLIQSASRSSLYMLLATLLGSVICWFGIQKGVEKCVKYLMCALLGLMLVLAVYALSTPGRREGLAFYLWPNWGNFIQRPLETIFAAMGQAFFTLSLGVGSMTIFGSYLKWKKPLAKECLWIILLDTFVALCAGVIVFPICKSYAVDVNQGPGLLFVSLPSIFNNIPLGRLWGTLFFLFMAMAALTTIVAVFENLIAYLQDEYRFSRRKATSLVGIAVAVLSLPCVFGYNLLSCLKPFGGDSTILDFEDFLVSQNLLPLGSLAMICFCLWKGGWGEQHFWEECEAGQEWHFPQLVRFYSKYILPLVIILVFVMGYIQMFR